MNFTCIFVSSNPGVNAHSFEPCHAGLRALPLTTAWTVLPAQKQALGTQSLSKSPSRLRRESEDVREAATASLPAISPSRASNNGRWQVV